MKAAGQHTGTAEVPGEVTGVCIECAVRNHHFRQGMCPAMGVRNWPEMSLYEAWIDGRRHTLLPAVGARMSCRECGRATASVYTPSD